MTRQVTTYHHCYRRKKHTYTHKQNSSTTTIPTLPPPLLYTQKSNNNPKTLQMLTLPTHICFDSFLNVAQLWPNPCAEATMFTFHPFVLVLKCSIEPQFLLSFEIQTTT